MALLALPGVAGASPGQVIRDCFEDERLDGNYSQKDLRRAEEELPTDIDEYSDCRDEIRRARLGQRRGGPGSPGGAPGGGFPTESGAVATSKEDADAVDELGKAAREDRAPAPSVGGRRIRVGTGGLYRADEEGGTLPTSLAAALIALGTLGTGGGFLALRGRLSSIRRVALRLLRR